METVSENLKQEKHYPSHFGEVYNTMPEKFEKRNDKVKPFLYYGLAAICVLLVIFPGWLPMLPAWLIRTIGIIGAIYFIFGSMVAGFAVYNKQSGGKITAYKTKKFISSETNIEDIIAAFNHHDFEYLCNLPSGHNQPVQLQVEKDETGREFYCILITFVAGAKIVGLADPVILSGSEYEKNEAFIRHMCDNDVN